MLSEQNQEYISTILQKIQEAEAIIVGGAAGMSAASGYNWYRDDAMFRKYFNEFAEKYGIDSIFGGFYHPFRTEEEQWAYLATLINFVADVPLGQPYKDLDKILRGKNYFILTTNQDTQFLQVFPEEKVSAIQGNWTYLQCSRRCHDGIYPYVQEAKELCAHIEGTRIPSDMVPQCPVCGGTMELWVRSRVFLEGSKYRSEINKYHEFLVKNQTKKVLFLELGVGQMTPMFIKEPFWNMTYNWPDAYYITINPKDALLPKELKDKGLAIHEDIAPVLRNLVLHM
ncbi:NAD-dependent protein deacetylase [Paenibacillus sp. M-152]|uniref:NAD-dependent protein deacetylase n=1 Tax=Paenibacillus sp. M-152 TaxID=2487928 RepID=UPI000F6BD11E|nr:NAD-dependent protein deacetylase [Paenibacillus sp. M-152]AZH29587.1 NAD-dependent protein deacetylase [Paenibacillus sp. M-152]